MPSSKVANAEATGMGVSTDSDRSSQAKARSCQSLQPLPEIPEEFRVNNLVEFMRNRGVKESMESCLRMVRPGGLYFLHSPVNGYYPTPS